MKFRIKKDGETRSIRFFAILPYVGDHQVRWLEWVEVEEVYRTDFDHSGWEFIRFLN